MILTPQQISQCIDNGKFSDAERAIVHFLLFNADEKNELNVASSNDVLKSSTQQNQVVLEANCTNYVTVITNFFVTQDTHQVKKLFLHLYLINLSSNGSLL